MQMVLDYQHFTFQAILKLYIQLSIQVQQYIEQVTNNIMRCNTKEEAIEYLTRLRRDLLEGTINLYE